RGNRKKEPGGNSENAAGGSKAAAIIRAFPPGVSAVFISSAFAQGAPQAAPGFDMTMLMIIGMFVLMYFFMIRPQTKRAKEHREMLDALQKGDEVITAGGVAGRVTKLGEQYLTVEIAPETEIVVQKSAVQLTLPKGTLKTLQ